MEFIMPYGFKYEALSLDADYPDFNFDSLGEFNGKKRAYVGYELKCLDTTKQPFFERLKIDCDTIQYWFNQLEEFNSDLLIVCCWLVEEHGCTLADLEHVDFELYSVFDRVQLCEYADEVERCSEEGEEPIDIDNEDCLRSYCIERFDCGFAEAYYIRTH